jgi:ABC-2 type transport system permease protein
MIDPTAIYVLWFREMIKFFRSKFRIIGAIAMPLFMLVFMGFGFRRVDVPGLPAGISYLQYFVPGILGMTLLFTGAMVGMVVLMDRQFGFLKEVMVTPASRVSIVLGRIAGGVSTSLIQALVILAISILMGFPVSGFLQGVGAFLVMFLISVIFISLGLILSSRLRDVHDYNNIMNFMVFPIFLLSGALFPLQNLPEAIRIFSFVNPLTYGVDALRGLLIGVSAFPLAFDVGILVVTSFAIVIIAASAFRTGDAI